MPPTLAKAERIPYDSCSCATRSVIDMRATFALHWSALLTPAKAVGLSLCDVLLCWPTSQSPPEGAYHALGRGLS
jgi:hypothetical protein